MNVIAEPLPHPRVAALLAAPTPAERRAALVALEQESRKHPQVDPPLRHHFAPGLYAREIFMHAGLVVVGKIHWHAHVNTVSKGACIVVTEDGLQRLEAGDTWVSKAGTKRAVFVEQDVLWTTVHANPDNCRDLGVLEARLIAPSFDDLFIDAAPQGKLQ